MKRRGPQGCAFSADERTAGIVPIPPFAAASPWKCAVFHREERAVSFEFIYSTYYLSKRINRNADRFRFLVNYFE